MMQDNHFQAMRDAMIESQLRPSGVSDRGVIRAMASVPREEYVPATRAQTAYADRSVPLGDDRYLMPPVALGRLLTRAEVRPEDAVLIVGAGTGYSAAVLSQLAASITAVESDEALLAAARTRLAGAANVILVQADLTAGHGAQASYDLIVIDGAVEAVPDDLAALLKDDGRLVCGIVDDGLTRLAIARKRAGGLRPVAFEDNEVPVLPGFAAAKAFKF